MSTTIHVTIAKSLASSYPILLQPGLLVPPFTWIPTDYLNSTIIIITDSCVKNFYAQSLLQNLITCGYKALLLSFPAGEKSKNIKTKCRLEQQMFANACGRDSIILAVGGGVVGDLAGFIAATYMRGIPYIQIPTTLLSMVDSSVGGKTAIDSKYGKNLIGAFWHPQAVVADSNCLKTLPKEHIINGLVEVIKIFLTCDAASLVYLQENLACLLSCDTKILIDIIDKAITIKARIVEKDAKDINLRAILNFGHTIGHAIESLTNYTLLHGYAVAIGILLEAKISQLMGILDANNYLYIKNIFNNLSIKTNILKKLDVQKIIQSTKLDKKCHSGAVKYVLLQNMGQVYENNNQFTHIVSDNVVKEAFFAILED